MDLASLVAVLYLLFTTWADSMARTTGFIRRVRSFDGSTFLQTLVFGWLRRPDAPLEHLGGDLGISRQALDQHFSSATVAFCKAALLRAIRYHFQARPDTLAWLRPFSGVFLDDCTQLSLPDSASATFPACAQGKAGLKLLLRGELQGGALHHLGIHPARTGDPTTMQQTPPLPPGCLHLADLGFTDFARLQQEDTAGIYWICRLPVRTRLFLSPPPPRVHVVGQTEGTPMWQQLRQWRQQRRALVDERAWVGVDHLVAGRLVALACPDSIVARRLLRLAKEAKRLNRPISERQRELCHWTVMWTNVPSDWLHSEQVWQVYRLRWQIELLIKRFKSEGGLGQINSTKKERVEAELYLKLLGQVVRNWLQMLHGGPLRAVNSTELGRVISDALPEVQKGLRADVETLFEALWQLRQRLAQVRPRTRRRGCPTAAQRLADADMASPSTAKMGQGRS
jgi:hypothetical protein